MDAKKAVALIQLLADTIIETAEGCPEGVPSGVVYSAMNAYGIGLATYQSILSALVSADRITVKGNLIFAKEPGR